MTTNSNRDAATRAEKRKAFHESRTSDGDHAFAEGVVTGSAPKPGDRIRVTRTVVTTTVYEGFLTPAVERDSHETGDSWLHELSPRPGVGMRLRDNGPLDYSAPYGGSSIERDTIELLESREAAEFDHLVTSAAEGRRIQDDSEEEEFQDDSEEEEFQASMRRDDRAKRRDKIARLLGRDKETKS